MDSFFKETRVVAKPAKVNVENTVANQSGWEASGTVEYCVIQNEIDILKFSIKFERAPSEGEALRQTDERVSGAIGAILTAIEKRRR